MGTRWGWVCTFREKHSRISPLDTPQTKQRYLVGYFWSQLLRLWQMPMLLERRIRAAQLALFSKFYVWDINVGVAFLLGCYIWRYFPHCICAKNFSYSTRFQWCAVCFWIFRSLSRCDFKACWQWSFSSPDDDPNAKLDGQARDTLIQNPLVMDDFSLICCFCGIACVNFCNQKSLN